SPPDWRQFTLSPRERAGVRGTRRSNFNLAQIAPGFELTEKNAPVRYLATLASTVFAELGIGFSLLPRLRFGSVARGNGVCLRPKDFGENRLMRFSADNSCRSN